MKTTFFVIQQNFPIFNYHSFYNNIEEAKKTASFLKENNKKEYRIVKMESNGKDFSWSVI